MLDEINSIADLKKMDEKNLPKLCEEIREFILPIVKNNGGHLSSNLGVVELTVALHYVFDETDKVVWDVGHQSYIHKILTGRKDTFSTLRTLGGISGFPDISESSADAFGTGHASTAISAALGLATARDLKGEQHNVVAVVGDGALTGGLSFEGLNNVNGRKMLIIVNDNNMSINQSVGMLSKMRVGKYEKRKVKYEARMQKTAFSRGLLKFTNFVKRIFKFGVIKNNLYFNSFNAKYVGIIDGHNVAQLIYYLKQIKENVERTTILHIRTIKGKGYAEAENSPEKYHGLTSVIEKAIVDISMSNIVGQTLCELAEYNDKIVAVCAAMKDGTGLQVFAEKFPNRFFDCGIAEQHSVTFAAGLCAGGLKPFVCVYSTFMQRAFDQILHDCCAQNLPVVFCLDRAGFSGPDGKTHQGLFDLSYLTCIPNLTVLAPADETQLAGMLYFASAYNKPVAIRYPKSITYSLGLQFRDFSWDKVYGDEFSSLPTTNKIDFIACGNNMLVSAIRIAEKLSKAGINANVFNACTIKPLDVKLLDTLKGHRHIFTFEENVGVGGLGSAVTSYFADSNCKVHSFCVEDKFVTHGTISQQIISNGLDTESLYSKITKILI